MEKLDAKPAQKPRKKHTGLVILLVFLAILILIPVGAYVFLSCTQFGGDGVALADYANAPYTGEAELSADGTASVLLKEADVYWIAAQNGAEDVLKLLPKEITLLWWRAQLTDGGVDIYAKGTALGFIPVSVKANIAMSESGGVITAAPMTFMLGTKLTIAADKLYKYGLQPSYETTLEEIGLPSRVTSVTFDADAVRVNESFDAATFEYLAAGVHRTAFECMTYGGEAAGEGNPFYLKAAKRPQEDMSAGEVFSTIAQSGSVKDAVNGLVALCEAHYAELALEEFNDFEKHFILTGTSQEQQALRDGYLKVIEDGQRGYENLLVKLREKYKALELTLDASCMIDNLTGEPLALSSLGNIDDASSRVLMLYSQQDAQTVRTYDMPPLSEVPKTGKKVISAEDEKRTVDLAILLRLASGAPALIYYQGDGIFVVHYLPEELYLEVMETDKLVIMPAGALPYPLTWGLPWAAPGDGLSKYSILYPPM